MEELSLFGRGLIKVFTDRPRSIVEILEETVRNFGNKDAFFYEKERMSYNDLGERSDCLAAVLQKRFGIKKDDRVATIVGNRLEFPVIVFACMKLGAIMVPINVKLRVTEIAYILNHSKPKALILENNYLAILKEYQQSHQEHVISEEQVVVINGQNQAANFASVLSEESSYTKNKVEETDTAFILYTSGTTGKPKGAMLSHIGVVHSVMHYKRRLETDSSMRTMIAVPLFHVTGLVAQMIHMVYIGGSSVILNRYQNEKYIIQSYDFKVNFHFNVPTIFIMMSTSPLLKEVSFDFVKKVAFGGSPIYQQTLEQLHTIFPNASLHNAYGATETTSPATIMPVSYPLSKATSVGLPVDTAVLKVVDDSLNELPPNQVGELLIKGPMVVGEYWDNKEANQTSFTDGYWCSGDIAKIDDDGFVYILDRKKDMINRGGEKIFSIEVEDVLKKHPEVKQAAVVSSPDPIFGEKVKAFIVSDTLTDSDIEKIKEYCSLYLAKFKVPELFEFIDVLPQNAAGKVLKQRLR